MLAKFFRLKEYNTNFKTEVIAGLTTFVTMAYIIIVNPAILQVAGIPKEPSMIATILSAFFGTLIMSLYAKRPFAIAPYMGENAFIAFTVVKVLGYNWQTAIGAVFIGGVIFTLLSVLRLRGWLARAIPHSLKCSFATGIGLFLTFIGLNESGIITLGTPNAPVKLGNISDLSVLLAISGFLIIAILLTKRIKGAVLIGILTVTFLSFLTGHSQLPNAIVRMPDITGWFKSIFLKLDILGALSWGFFSVILTVFIMDFVDTMGTLIGVSARANLLDEEGNLPEIEKPMLADALATIFGALCGTTTCGTYIESAAGIEEGGRTGLTSLVTSCMFLLALFFTPLFTAVPAIAYGPALIIVGLLMLNPITKIDFSDYTEIVPAFSVIVLMSFTYNIGIGITAGFVLYPLFKIISGRFREIHSGLWILSILSLLFFIFYPYA